MLVLSRNLNEEIVITAGEHVIVITLVKASLDFAKLGFDAGPDVTIHRGEIQRKVDAREGDRA